MNDDPLSTLVQACRHVREIRKSRFLAQAAPVRDTVQAQAFVHEISDAAATHNCWAWRIGQEYRFNDDGEPGGTAGRPILQAIEGQDMDRVVVVVTRWYGGIKLGAGGLARAYGGTAAECLRLSQRTALIAMAHLSTRCDFAEHALLRARLTELGADIEQEHFDADGVSLRFQLPRDRAEEARQRIIDLSRGRSDVHTLA